MDPLVIHGFPQSTYTRTARMAAHEKGVTAGLVPLAFGEPAHFALHPFGKMPAMTHRDVALFETLAIVSYIDDAFDGPVLIPRTPAARAATLGAISVAIDYAYRPVVHTARDGDSFTAEALAKAGAVLDWLDRRTACGFIDGRDLTAADLFFAPMVAYHQATVGAGLAFRQRPSLAAWLDAMRRRPSFAATEAG